MCSNFVLRILLILINLMTFIIGLVATVLGALIKFDPVMINKYLDEYVKKIADGLGGDEIYKIFMGMLDTGLKDVGIFGLVLFITGIVVTVYSLAGLIGACCDVKAFYKIYMMCTIIIILLTAGMIIAHYVKKSAIKDALNEVYEDAAQKYTTMKAKNMNSIIVAMTQWSMECCADRFLNGSYTASSDYYKKKNYTDLTMPLVCCMVDEDYSILKDGCERSTRYHVKGIYTESCTGKVGPKIAEYLELVAFILFVVLVLLTGILVITAISITCVSE